MVHVKVYFLLETMVCRSEHRAAARSDGVCMCVFQNVHEGVRIVNLIIMRTDTNTHTHT